jgi:hypothetical protein
MNDPYRRICCDRLSIGTANKTLYGVIHAEFPIRKILPTVRNVPTTGKYQSEQDAKRA